jgi:bifunctional non-homologous end joining protein LigD
VSLESYRRKRDFARTPEPSGEAASGEETPGRTPTASDRPGMPRAGSVAGGRFVVQRHRARNLHYDFRFEIDGVLVSWAVPKGPTLDPAIRRGAYHVEDHPLDYFDFEGTIPAGQYGAGDVIVWDWGRYRAEATDDPGRAVGDGELKFELFGEKLRGRFTIVRTRGGVGVRGGSGRQTEPREREAWLLIKKRDASAVSGWETETLPRSVKSGRTNDEVAAGVAPRTPLEPAPASGAAGAPLSPMPGFIEPMKATPAAAPFSNPAWIFELKWDGYRVQAHVVDGKVALFTRRGNDAVSYFPELSGPPTWLAARDAILDGEVVALNGAGEPDFRLLQAWHEATRSRRPAASTDPGREAASLVYEVFDLLYLDGHSLLDLALEDRKRVLRSILIDSRAVRYAGHVDGEGEAFYAAVSARGLEGMVAKLGRSRYEPGRRSPSWLKIKRRADGEFVVGGWTPRTGTESDLGALLLGVYDAGALHPVGKVGTGFDAPERSRLLALLAPMTRPTSPFRPAPKEKGVRWVEPRLVARVEFDDWPLGGALRAPSYRGLDLDIDPLGVVREAATAAPNIAGGPPAADGASPESLAERSSRKAGLRGATNSGGATAAITAAEPAAATAAELAALDALPARGGSWSIGGHGLKLSNLDKPIWPADAITKRDLIRYYTSIAPYVLPYLRGRALTVLRHPDGIDRPGFWQKQLPSHTPSWVARWSWESVSADETRDYAVAEGAATLAWLANEAAIDLHPSTFRIDAPNWPTWALIDIDPGQNTTWDEVLVLGRLYRTALDHVGVTGFPKVSGQRGIQVWVPIRAGYSFEETRDWVGGISRAVGAAVPELVSWVWEKTRRSGLARLDYTQNAANKTLVAPYAARPVPGAPVSAPISWDELDDPTLRPNGWTIRSIFYRLAERGDLFAPALALEQDLPPL